MKHLQGCDNDHLPNRAESLPLREKKIIPLHGASDDPLLDTRLKQISHITHIWSQDEHAALTGSITEVLKLWYMYHQWELIFYIFITLCVCVCVCVSQII